MLKKIYHTDKKVLMFSCILSVVIFIIQAINIYIDNPNTVTHMNTIILLFFILYGLVFYMDYLFFSTYYHNNNLYLCYYKTQRILVVLLLIAFLFIALLEISKENANSAVLRIGVIHFVYFYFMNKLGVYKKMDELASYEYLLSVSGYERRKTWK